MQKAVLFDAGGTLIHMDRRFLIQTLNENGVPADLAAFSRADAVARGEISRLMRSENPGTDASRWIAYAGALMRELDCEGAALAKVRAVLWQRHQGGELWTFVEDGTIDALEKLKHAGYRIGVVSNADGRVATFLEKAGLTKYFDVIVDSGEFGIEKPDPRIFAHALERMGIEPKGTYYVGDVYEIDAVGARAAGLTPIILTSELHPDWDCMVIRSIAELPEVLARGA